MIMRSFIKKGKGNAVADALSRKYEDEGSLFSLSSLVQKWVEKECQEWLYHDSTAQVITLK